ncbi:MAG: hypothetical protein U0793_19340 [Gemmataceae bacterium]
MRLTSAFALFLLPSLAAAQPTYKLGVDSHVYPGAVLKLEGARLSRGAVKDDPGFRLQFHVLKDGKSLQTKNARLEDAIDLPTKEPGDYAAVLELFYPAYKGGSETKGQFKAISPYLLYNVSAPGGPIKTLTREPALVLDCGKGDGKAQDVKLAKDYGYKLIQGKPLEGWPAAVKKHAWMDPKSVRFEIALPKETPGTLRLLLVDGDTAGRKCKVVIQGRPLPVVADFGGPGKQVEMPLSTTETKTGKIEVSIEALDKGTAVVSTVEFVPAFAK